MTPPTSGGTRTHCPYCSLQCGMTLVGARTTTVEPWPEFPVNEGALCRKGWSATGLLGHRERLTTPMVRDRATGAWSAATWDEALDLVARRLREVQAEHGADGVGRRGARVLDARSQRRVEPRRGPGLGSPGAWLLQDHPADRVRGGAGGRLTDRGGGGAAASVRRELGHCWVGAVMSGERSYSPRSRA